MPNHCQNELWIEGKTEDVDALLAHIAGPDRILDFNTIIPYPEHFRTRDEEFEKLPREEIVKKYGERAQDGYNSGGIEWCRTNWDTKWNAYAQSISRDGGTCIRFQTAWSPPQAVIVALHKLFPKCTLHLEWFERGAAKCGGWTHYSADDFEGYEESGEWSPGEISNEWGGDYRGHKGG